MMAASASTGENYAQIARILRSKAFRTSEVHRNLLNYLAEKSLSGEADSVKEYSVGLDVFGKPASYDPRQESVVRMHLARVRQKLAEYYRTEGADDTILIDLPKGAFKVTFEPRPAAAIEPQPPRPSYKIEIVLAALLIAALSAAAYFRLQLHELRKSPNPSSTQTASSWTPELEELWSPLLAQDRPLVVVLETQESGNVTGLSTANGAFLLGQFLSDRKPSVYVTGSAELSMPDVMMGNLVVLGRGTEKNPQLQALPTREVLVMESGGIRNLRPSKGEPAFLPNPPARIPPATVDESYALITHAPGMNGKGDVLYLSGNHPSSPTAGVEAFTDPELAGSIMANLRGSGRALPRYYQIVLRVRSMDDTPIEITYMMHKVLPTR